MRQKPGLPKPPNLAARALRDGVFRQRTVKSAKTYSRKIKHRKGEHQNGSPFCCPRQRERRTSAAGSWNAVQLTEIMLKRSDLKRLAGYRLSQNINSAGE